VFAFWLAGLALFALVVVNVDLFLPRGVSSPFRLVVGLVLLIERAGLTGAAAAVSECAYRPFDGRVFAASEPVAACGVESARSSREALGRVLSSCVTL
jgi:hypothetical protein